QVLVVLGIVFLGLPLWRQGIEAAFEAWRSRRRLERDPARWRAFEASRIRFGTWVGARSYAAAVLIGAFALTYAVMVLVGPERAVDEFALVNEKVREGEWWRLLSCAFLHGGLVHLFFNSAAGWSLARIARSIASEAQILLAFFLSAVAGSVASTLLLGETSIGASGGILGWGGMLLGMALRHKELRPTGLASNIMRWVVVIALIGVAGMGFVDNAAHAGGFLAGLAMGLWFVRDEEVALPTGRPLPLPGWIAVGAVLGAPWLWMLWVMLSARFAGR
ncbi:MAG TPA: rhomboid family intramembrane serine protease, partial [Planctomycetota bacterium]|nr:rhomboid family intramembrane serine protease [Planctomycetota bacterium]